MNALFGSAFHRPFTVLQNDDETVYVKNILEMRRRKTTFRGMGKVDERFLMPAMLHPYFVCGKMLCDTIPRSLFSHPQTSLTLPETIQSRAVI